MLPILSTRVNLSKIPSLSTWFRSQCCKQLLPFSSPSAFVCFAKFLCFDFCHFSSHVPALLPIVFTCFLLALDEFVCLISLYFGYLSCLCYSGDMYSSGYDFRFRVPFLVLLQATHSYISLTEV